MNINNVFKTFNSNQMQNNSDKSSENYNNAQMMLYPELENNAKQNVQQNSQDTQNSNINLNTVLQLISLFNSKKMDITSLLSSPIGKKLGVNENVASILSLLNSKNSSKIQSVSQKESLPKIDSLERLK